MRTPLMRIRIGGFVLVLVFVVAVFGYHFFGGYDWLSAVFMVVITISTVGYGETSGLSPAVQAFSILVIVVGISASVYTIGGLIQLMLEGELERVLGRRRMIKDIQNLTGHSIICGYGRMGHNLAIELTEQGRDLVIIDHDLEKTNEAAQQGFLCVTGDATEEQTLLDAGLIRAGTLVSTFPNDAESVFITLTARNLCPTVTIISRAERESTQQKLHQAGANTVIMPTIVSARQMGRMITRPSTAHLISLVDEGSNREFDLDELAIEAGSPLVGMSVGATEAHKRHRLLVVAIKDSDGKIRFNPDANEHFATGDVVMVIGHRDHIDAYRAEYGELPKSPPQPD